MYGGYDALASYIAFRNSNGACLTVCEALMRLDHDRGSCRFPHCLAKLTISRQIRCADIFVLDHDCGSGRYLSRVCATCGYILFGKLLQIISILISRTTCYSTMKQQRKCSSTSECTMRIVVTDDPMGNSTPVHVYFLPTRLPAPGTSPGWIYKLLVRVSRADIVPRCHHSQSASSDAAHWFFDLAREHLERRGFRRYLCYWDSMTLTYHHHRVRGWCRNSWREHIACTESEAASICSTLLQRGMIHTVRHSVCEWDCGCCIMLQNDELPPTRTEITQLIMHARSERLLSLKLRLLGLPQIDRVWCDPEWPIAGRYKGETTPEIIFDGEFSGKPHSYDKLIF